MHQAEPLCIVICECDCVLYVGAWATKALHEGIAALTLGPLVLGALIHVQHLVQVTHTGWNVRNHHPHVQDGVQDVHAAAMVPEVDKLRIDLSGDAHIDEVHGDDMLPVVLINAHAHELDAVEVKLAFQLGVIGMGGCIGGVGGIGCIGGSGGIGCIGGCVGGIGGCRGCLLGAAEADGAVMGHHAWGVAQGNTLALVKVGYLDADNLVI